MDTNFDFVIGLECSNCSFPTLSTSGSTEPPQYPPKILGGHNNAFLKHDHWQMSHLQTTFFNNCTNQLNVSYYTLFLCTHTINYLNCRNYKIGESDQYNGWEAIKVREACAAARWFATHSSRNNVKMSNWAKHPLCQNMRNLRKCQNRASGKTCENLPHNNDGM